MDVSKRAFGIIASIVGSAVGTWYFMRQRAGAGASGDLTPARERGTVIFDNTPTAAPTDPL